MRPFLESEMLRTPLEEICLLTKKLGLAPGRPDDDDGIPAFLAKAMTPPHEKSILNALDLLVDIGAMMPESNDLTALGQCLSVLSLEPRVGKMVIWSYLLGCTKPISQMAIAMSYKSPFSLPVPSMRKYAERAMVEMSRGSESDQVTIYSAMLKHDQIKKKQSEGAWKDFCRRNFLNGNTLNMILQLRTNISRYVSHGVAMGCHVTNSKESSYAQLASILSELQSLNFPDPMHSGGVHNRNQSKEALWQAALAAGLYPNICTRRKGDLNFSTMTNRKCKIHISSVNAVKGQPMNSKCEIPVGEVEFVCFGEMVKGAHMFTISQTTHLASPVPLVLLCGTSLTVRQEDADDGLYAVLGLDDWIFFKCASELAAGLVVLRKRLDVAFVNAMSKASFFTSDRSIDPADRDAIDTLETVLQSAMKSSRAR